MAFGQYINNLAARGILAVQPRMGFAKLDRMRKGLAEVKAGPAGTIGTITVDAYTRVGQEERAERALCCCECGVLCCVGEDAVGADAPAPAGAGAADESTPLVSEAPAPESN